MGFAKFFLFPVDTAYTGVSANPGVITGDDFVRQRVRLLPINGCPAVPIQTDATGRYFADLLPEMYVIGDAYGASQDTAFLVFDDVNGYMSGSTNSIVDPGAIVVMNDAPTAVNNDTPWYEGELINSS